VQGWGAGHGGWGGGVGGGGDGGAKAYVICDAHPRGKQKRGGQTTHYILQEEVQALLHPE
jgi:hypothetical protein